MSTTLFGDVLLLYF